MLNAELNTIPWMHYIVSAGFLIHSHISQTKKLILLLQIKIRFIFVTYKDDYKNFA